jgi:hypothetical protein
MQASFSSYSFPESKLKSSLVIFKQNNVVKSGIPQPLDWLCSQPVPLLSMLTCDSWRQAKRENS